MYNAICTGSAAGFLTNTNTNINAHDKNEHIYVLLSHLCENNM